MPRWLLRLVWAIRGKRRVRLHFEGATPSVEGILIGHWGGHYVLFAPTVHEAENQTVRLEGHLEVPDWQVALVQVLG